MLWSKGHDGHAILSLCSNMQKKLMLPIYCLNNLSNYNLMLYFGIIK